LLLPQNEDKIAGQIANVFSAVIDRFSYPVKGVSVSEDFGFLARSTKDQTKSDIPYCYWHYASTDSKKWEQYGGIQKVPADHGGNPFLN
jgi:hypothetical protein